MTTVDNEFCLECMECDDQCTNECADLCCLTDSMNALNLNNNINTIVITKLVEKFTSEMNYSKIFIKEKNCYYLNIELPEWFNDLDNKYQSILIKVIEPVLNHYIREENNIDYLVIEEPDFNSKCKRNKKATPFDFYFIIILLLRKLYSKKYTYSEIDYKIGVLFSNLFLVRFNYDNLITISQSMISFFRGFNNYSNIYDLQHGIIHKNKKDYFYKNSADLKGCRIYVALFPCNECSKMIIQCGINEVIFLSDKYHDTPSMTASRRMFQMAGIKTRQLEPKNVNICLDCK